MIQCRSHGAKPPQPLRALLSGLLIAVFCVFLLSGTALADNDCTATTNAEFAAKIAHGHAFTKHSDEFVEGKVIAGLAFPDPTITNADAFGTFLDGILAAPSDNKPLTSNRHGYWDDKTGTVIITNLAPIDCGTAFRPDDGKVYYDDLN